MSALSELSDRVAFWSHLGYRDLRSRYARTRLGAWWSAGSLFAVVIGISLTVGLLSDKPITDLAPRVAVAMAMWILISSVLNESAEAFVADRGILLNLPISERMMTARLLWRNYLVYLHNAAVMLIFLLLDSGSISSILRLTIVVFVLGPMVVATLFVPALVLSRLGARFPDLRVFAGTAVQLNFFITPVLWDPPATGVMRTIFLLNPLGWYVQLSKEAVFLGRLPTELVVLVLSLFILSATVYLVAVRRLPSIKKYL